LHSWTQFRIFEDLGYLNRIGDVLSTRCRWPAPEEADSVLNEFLREASAEPDILLPDDLPASAAARASSALQQWKEGGRPMAGASAMVRARIW
jgi:hypothetical protein